MSFKTSTTTHNSETCPGVKFKLYMKTYGMKLKLDRQLSDYNQSIRGLAEERTALLEEAKIKANAVLGISSPRAESVIQINRATSDDGTQKQVADMTSVEDSPAFRREMMRQVDMVSLARIDDRTNEIHTAELRPIYMDVYLHSVDDLETEDGIPIRYKAAMAKSDKQLFFEQAPSVLIDEIFSTIDKEIGLNGIERANFGLPTTGGAAVVPAKKDPTPLVDTTVKPAEPENSTSSESAESPTLSN